MSNKNLVEYNHLLFLLHEEMAFGRGEEEYADNLRDQSEPLWYLLSKEEREKADKFSEELYVIEDLCKDHYKK